MGRKKLDPKAELRRARAAANKGKHEDPFFLIFRARYPHLPAPTRDYMFAFPERKFKADFCWSTETVKLLVELDGGGARSRHTTVKGYCSDCDKLNLATQMGYKVLRFGVIQLRKMDEVVDFVAKFLE